MKTNRRFCFTLLSRTLCIVLALVALSARTARGRTIFVLTDTNSALFCNNEDWSDPKTRIWFVPGLGKHYGAVYVGFDNDYAQGGLNSEGLAFDWVAGYAEDWKPDPNVAVVYGNSGQRALESCATVEEAVAFFRTHQDPGFYRAKILLADRTGASVIIGGHEGKLQVEPASTCRGFGYAERTLDKMLAESKEPTVANGAKILWACRQKGQYATKYHNIFDLKSGDIFLYPGPQSEQAMKFNLAAELKKGGHYYDMPQIKEQLAQPLRPLLENMQRFKFEKYQPIADKEPKVTTRVRELVQDAVDGTWHQDYFTEALWKQESPNFKETQTAVKTFGPLVSLALVDRGEEGSNRSYRYRVAFEKNTILQQFVFDGQNKLTASRTEEIQ
jgi:hypothetical protein